MATKASASKKAKPTSKAPKAKDNKAKGKIGEVHKPTFVAQGGQSWLLDASVEVPVSPRLPFKAGQRELEFSVGMRQQPEDGLIRSEMRGRALVHAEGQVLAVVEASYVNMSPENEIPADLPQQLYNQLKPQLESLLKVAGHTPPLPPSLEKVA